MWLYHFSFPSIMYQDLFLHILVNMWHCQFDLNHSSRCVMMYYLKSPNRSLWSSLSKRECWVAEDPGMVLTPRLGGPWVRSTCRGQEKDLMILSPSFLLSSGRRRKVMWTVRNHKIKKWCNILKKLQKHSLHVNSSPADTPVESWTVLSCLGFLHYKYYTGVSFLTLPRKFKAMSDTGLEM